jgi:hypothetical protein
MQGQQLFVMLYFIILPKMAELRSINVASTIATNEAAVQQCDVITIVNVNWCRVRGECDCIDNSEVGGLDSTAVDRGC